MIKDNIDFSSKHDILIRHPNGSLLPMDVPYFESELIAPGTWRIGTDGDAIYLVEGDDEAVVIDSGYGAGNLRDFCASITEKPVRNIINTHDHFDHTANNAYFEKAFMSAASVPLATIPFPSFEGIDFPRDYEIQVVKEGDIISLGGRDLEVIETPDHAVGSIMLLDSREGILFVGDELSDFFKKINGSVSAVLAQFKKLEERLPRIKVLWGGGGGPFKKEIIEEYLQTFEYIVAGGETEEGFGFPNGGMPPRQEPGPEGVTVFNRFSARPCDMKLKDELGGNLRHTRKFGHLVVFDADNI